MEQVLAQEELSWFQKSKEDWIFSGNQNTIYYHLSAIVKKRNGKISRLKDGNGNWVDQDNEIKNLV